MSTPTEKRKQLDQDYLSKPPTHFMVDIEAGAVIGRVWEDKPGHGYMRIDSSPPGGIAKVDLLVNKLKRS